MQSIQIFACQDVISHVEWSPDSMYILAAQYKKAVVQVFSIQDPEWTCLIEEGLSGLTFARWVPDSRQIITISQFQLKLTVWSLIDRSVSYIKNPKHSDRALSFSSDGKFMALAERRDTKDYMGIYYTEDWKLVNHFQLDSVDLNDLRWAPDDSAIVVWDNCIDYRLMVYCPAQGLIAKHQPYENALGIKSVEFSQNGQFLAVGSYDQKARIFNHISWRLITELEHKTQMSEGAELHVYKEEEYREGPAYGLEDRLTSRYVMQNLPLKINSIKPSTDKPNPQMGVSLALWSPDSKYLVTKNDNMPTTLWLWDMTTLTLHVVLIQFHPIKSVAWSPKTQHLAFSTGTGRIFLWSEEGASVCDIPIENRQFNVQKIQWNPEGDSILLGDKGELLMAYPQFEFFDDEEEGLGEDHYDDQ